MIEKKYQVFVSSTYIDLKEERREVMQALLELNCIPSGMELFPASDDEKWDLIKGVIDDCDYYIVVVGGRYGSVDEEGISYTEKEYKYALEQGKPILAFLYRNPDDLKVKQTDQDDQKRKKLEVFRQELERRVCKYWENPSELGSVASRSMIQLIQQKPGVGWVKADKLPDEDTSQLLVKLQKNNELLKLKINQISTTPPKGSEELAGGEDIVRLENIYTKHSYIDGDQSASFFTEPTWNEIFSMVSPSLIGEIDDKKLKNLISNFVDSRVRDFVRKKFNGDMDRVSFEINHSCYDTMKVQFLALGLITKSHKKRPVRDTETYLTLTPYGHTLMVQLKAIKKK